MKGEVNDILEPILTLSVLNQSGIPFEVDVLIDTGSTSELTLPRDVIDSLELVQEDEEVATLADGSEIPCRAFTTRIKWHSSMRQVRVIELNQDPLIGMRLLQRSLLFVDARPSGEVLVEPDGISE